MKRHRKPSRRRKTPRQARVVDTMKALGRIDRLYDTGRITKKEHDKRSAKVLDRALVVFK